MDNSINYFFRHSKTSLLTKHKKEKIIEPLVKHFLGIEIVHTDKYDTDLYGTFTRDVIRVKSQMETLRDKTKKGMELCDLEIGMASEGSFSTDPVIGMMPWNLEMVMLYDQKNEVEIIGESGLPFKPLQKQINSLPELLDIVHTFNFPENGLILRPDDESSPQFFKESSTLEELEKNFMLCMKLSTNMVVFVEADLRSHMNRERQKNIEYAVIDLINKCHSFCPECQTPGFWVNRGSPGLPCSLCGNETDTFRYLIYKCKKCGFEREIERRDKSEVGPENCGYCNP